jgi:hypothetical protein
MEQKTVGIQINHNPCHIIARIQFLIQHLAMQYTLYIAHKV